MTVQRTAGGTIALVGECPLEDAEPLLRLLLDHPGAEVDWHACQALHTAVIQVLLAARATLVDTPASPLLRTFVEPALRRALE